ncbi:MAG: DsbA family protein [Nitrosopumilaceae archaeon]
MKKGVIIGVIVAVIIAVLTTYLVSQPNVDLSSGNAEKKMGTVDTSTGSPVLGSSLAPITIVEFGDYQCPQCDKWYLSVRPDIERDYIQTGKAKLVFVDLAFFGPDSKKAAQASYCAEDQGKFWEYHGMLYENQGGINDGWASPQNLKRFASELNLDTSSFNDCLDSGKYQKRVENNIKIATQNGASGTPTFILISDENQKRIEGAQPYQVFKQELDSLL